MSCFLFTPAFTAPRSVDRRDRPQLQRCTPQLCSLQCTRLEPVVVVPRKYRVLQPVTHRTCLRMAPCFSSSPSPELAARTRTARAPSTRSQSPSSARVPCGATLLGRTPASSFFYIGYPHLGTSALQFLLSSLDECLRQRDYGKQQYPAPDQGEHGSPKAWLT